jgi:hypothetical protein
VEDREVEGTARYLTPPRLIGTRTRLWVLLSYPRFDLRFRFNYASPYCSSTGRVTPNERC